MRRTHGFSLVELLVVVGIIGVLIGILIPVVSRARRAAQVADSKNWLSQISSAIDRYHIDHKAYPGPISNTDIYNTTNAMPPVAVTHSEFEPGLTPAKITMSENLTLGLLGGLIPNPGGAGIQYNPSHIGLGPMNLNRANPKRATAYLPAENLSWRQIVVSGTTVKSGHYADESGDADDSMIPEFVDRFSEPMPILYLRSRLGIEAILTPSAAANSVITNGSRSGPYDIEQIQAYTGSFTGAWPSLSRDTATPASAGTRSIGNGKKMPPAYNGSPTNPIPTPAMYHGLRSVSPNAVMDKAKFDGAHPYVYPIDAYPYFESQSAGVPRQKDGYILISAGADRIYGTDDDICNFGEVSK